MHLRRPRSSRAVLTGRHRRPRVRNAGGPGGTRWAIWLTSHGATIPVAGQRRNRTELPPTEFVRERSRTWRGAPSPIASNAMEPKHPLVDGRAMVITGDPADQYLGALHDGRDV